VTRDKSEMFPKLRNYICDEGVDIWQTINGQLEQLAQKFVDYCGENMAPTLENDWIIDPFTGTDLP